MLVNLLEIWNNTLEERKFARDQNIENRNRGNQAYSPSIDDKFMQSSFDFDSNVRVIFIKSSLNLEAATLYDELPSIPMSGEEALAVKVKLEELQKNPKFYDGDQLLIRGVLYDPEAAVIYLEAVQVKYSFLSTLQAKRFPDNSSLNQLKLYKTGVIAPFITNDEHVFLMERNDQLKLYSAASGFLEPFGEERELNPTKYDLVVHTAKQEALEEFLAAKDSLKERISFDLPSIASISFRETENGLGTIEFIAPMRLHCQKEKLQNLLKDNQAKDKHEHTENFYALTLKPEERNKAINFLQLKKPGGFLYDPILLNTSRVANSVYYNYRDYMPTHLPESRTRAFPARGFSSSIPRQLSLTWQWDNNSKKCGTSESVQEREDFLENQNKYRY
jgi:hypothetical protein